MKRLLLLFVIPTLSYSQITFNDIMSINSEKSFKRVVIENDFEFGGYEGTYIFYGIDILRDSIEGDKSPLWGGYNQNNNEFYFMIYDSDVDVEWLNLLMGETDESLYNSLVKQIKKNCEFYDIIEEYDDDYSCYSCLQSKYKGKIGFHKFDEGGIIRHIIPKKPITYKDIMSINSIETFNNVMIGNGYDFNEPNDTIIGYGYNIRRDSVLGNQSKEWGVYNKTNGEFYYKFSVDEDDDNDSYNLLVNEIKGRCKFYNSIDDYLSYDCSESSFEGRIDIKITDSVSFIKHRIPTEE